MADPTVGKSGQFYVPFPVLAVASSGDDVFLAAGGGGSTAQKEVPNVVHAMTYSEATGKLSTIAALNTVKSVCVHLSYSPKLDLWLASLKQGCKILRLSKEENTLTDLCEWQSEEAGKEPEQNFAKYSPDGSLIVTGGTDGFVKVWAAEKPPAVPVLKRICGNKQSEILDADFSADSKFVAACDGSGVCRVWEIAKEDPVDGTVITWSSKKVPGNNKAFIKLVRFVPSTDRPLTLLMGANGGRGPGMIGLFAADGTKLTEVLTDKMPIKSLAFDTDFSNLCVGLMSGAKVIYSYPGLKVKKKTKELHSLPCMMVCLTGEGTAISGSGDRDLHLLSTKGGGGGSPIMYVFVLLSLLIFVAFMVFRIGIKGAALGQGA